MWIFYALEYDVISEVETKILAATGDIVQQMRRGARISASRSQTPPVNQLEQLDFTVRPASVSVTAGRWAWIYFVSH